VQIVARQHDLHGLFVAECVVLVRVKVTHDELAVLVAELGDSVLPTQSHLLRYESRIPQEVVYFHAVDVLGACAVHPAESGVGLEIGHASQPLPLLLNF
jgi:hypothetical protein